MSCSYILCLFFDGPQAYSDASGRSMIVSTAVAETGIDTVRASELEALIALALVCHLGNLSIWLRLAADSQSAGVAFKIARPCQYVASAIAFFQRSAAAAYAALGLRPSEAPMTLKCSAAEDMRPELTASATSR